MRFATQTGWRNLCVAPNASGAYFCNAGHTALDDAHLVGYVLKTQARVRAGTVCALANADGYRHNSRHQRWNMSIYKNTKINEALSLHSSAETYRHVQSSELQHRSANNNGSLINPTTPIHRRFLRPNVDDSNFLKSSQFNAFPHDATGLSWCSVTQLD